MKQNDLFLASFMQIKLILTHIQQKTKKTFNVERFFCAMLCVPSN